MQNKIRDINIQGSNNTVNIIIDNNLRIVKCTRCKEDKLETNFNKNKNRKNGLSSHCKKCRSEYRFNKNRNCEQTIAKNLNISLEQAIKFINKGKNKCDICNSTKYLQYDHSHKSNLSRGILCKNCNTTIGKLGDELDKVKEYTNKIIAYLENPPLQK